MARSDTFPVRSTVGPGRSAVGVGPVSAALFLGLPLGAGAALGVGAAGVLLLVARGMVAGTNNYLERNRWW